MRRGGAAFVVYMAATYLRATRSGRRASAALSILGIGAGVMTLVAVIGVMNGLQLGFIEDILEVSSYHLQIEGVTLTPEQTSALRAWRGVAAAVAFTDGQALVGSTGADLRGALVRGIEAEAPVLDPGFARHLEIVEGSFGMGDGIVIGVELAYALAVGVGDTIRLLTLMSPGAPSGRDPGSAVLGATSGAPSRGDPMPAAPPGRVGQSFAQWVEMRVAGVFRTGYYDYDTSMAFVSLARATELFGAPPSPTYGVKLADRFADRAAAARIESGLHTLGVAEPARVVSWRVFNRAFFSALLLEKVLMFVLPGLIFVVVAFSIYHSLRRTVYERRDEIALLAALGARMGTVRAIHVLEGALLGFVGALPGLAAGLAISANVNRVFLWVESAVNAGIGFLEMVLTPLERSTGGDFAIFSRAFFYLNEVPSRVPLPEALGITFAGVACAALAALLASNRISALQPAEVLRDE